MSDILLLISLLVILAASFIFYKLSQIKWRGRCLIPIKYRVTISLVILLLVPAILLFGLAIAVILALLFLIAIVAFILSWFKLRR